MINFRTGLTSISRTSPMIRSIHSKASITLLPLLTLLLTVSSAQDSAKLPFGAWHRLAESPIISPQGNGWESAGTFNPAVISRDGKIVMLYRAQDKSGTSRLGYAESLDGIHFTRRSKPVLSPEKTTKKMAAWKTRGWFSSAIPTI